MAEILLGLGANLGGPAATIRRALRDLARGGLAVRTVSRFYATPPWGPVPQPDYVNACARVESGLSPRAVLAAVQAVEARLGRVRDGMRWGPRALDIDILFYGDLALDEPGLAIPHPRITERGFVLVPLAEIAPDRTVAGRTVAAWAATVDRTGIRPLPEEPDQDSYLTVQP